MSESLRLRWTLAPENGLGLGISRLWLTLSWWSLARKSDTLSSRLDLETAGGG